MDEPRLDQPQIDRLRQGIDALVRAFKVADDAAAGEGAARLNPSDLLALAFVGHRPGCNASDVAAHLGVVPTTATAVIDRLVRRGLLTRGRTEADRRVVVLGLTEAGGAAVRAQVAAQDANCRAMLAALDPGERDGFVAAIERIARSRG